MSALDIRPLSDQHPFGARISGVTMDNVESEELRARILDTFWDRGMIIFEGMKPEEDVQFAVSNIFGPSQDYAIKNTKYESKARPGLIDFSQVGREATIIETGGKQIAGHVPWHFDACYAEKLNRAGVLCVIQNAEEDGKTGFADGIQIYEALSPEWQTRAEEIDVIYWQANMNHRQRFGLPDDWRQLQLSEKSRELIEASLDIPRTVHPAVWQRRTGEKVLHVSPWQADGIAGMETSEGDALLEELIAQMHAAMTPYWHEWQPGDMAIWDNWRFVHSAGGFPPQYERKAKRTTIQGDYGLGCYEKDWKGLLQRQEMA